MRPQASDLFTFSLCKRPEKADSLKLEKTMDEFAQAVAGNNKQQGLIKLKLFLESEEEDTAEFYLNIHLERTLAGNL